MKTPYFLSKNLENTWIAKLKRSISRPKKKNYVISINIDQHNRFFNPLLHNYDSSKEQFNVDAGEDDQISSKADTKEISHNLAHLITMYDAWDKSLCIHNKSDALNFALMKAEAESLGVFI